MSAPFQTPQLHDPSQPPPAPGKTASRANDKPETTRPTQGQEAQGGNAPSSERSPGTTTLPPSSQADDAAPQRAQVQGAPEAQGRNAFTTDRPLGVTPAQEGGVAIGGQSNLPLGRANITDRIVGKTQKVIGKYTQDADLHEKGELRETGGKAAVEGRARAAHD